MDQKLYNMHLRAGQAYGQESACGAKIDYGSEYRAVRAALAMSKKSEKDFDYYPCYWCQGWHIGRA